MITEIDGSGRKLGAEIQIIAIVLNDKSMEC